MYRGLNICLDTCGVACAPCRAGLEAMVADQHLPGGRSVMRCRASRDLPNAAGGWRILPCGKHGCRQLWQHPSAGHPDTRVMEAVGSPLRGRRVAVVQAHGQTASSELSRRLLPHHGARQREVPHLPGCRRLPEVPEHPRRGCRPILGRRLRLLPHAQSLPSRMPDMRGECVRGPRVFEWRVRAIVESPARPVWSRDAGLEMEQCPGGRGASEGCRLPGPVDSGPPSARLRAPAARCE